MPDVAVAKISVEKQDSKEQFLYDLDKSRSLCEVVRDICKRSGLPESPVYGLKLIQTKNKPFVNTYVSENNYKSIQHMDCLKIVFSIDYLLEKRILPYINMDADCPERDICFEDLKKLSIDPVFIEKLVRADIYKYMINVYVTKELNNDKAKGLLMTICHLLNKGHITDTSQDILRKTIKIVQHSDECDAENLKYALSILHKILVQKDNTFLQWKEQIINDVQLNTLTQFIWNEKSKSVQYEVLLLVNTMIRLSKGEKKLQLIREMNLKQNRDNIYKHVIESGIADKQVEHELYVLQTYLLSLYNEALRTDINLNDNNLFKREDFELCEDDVRRLTILMDFEVQSGNGYFSESYPTDSVFGYTPTERISIASIVSDKTQSIRSSTKSSIDLDNDCGSINYLTLEALRHYKKNYYKIFYQSQVEEKVYEPGIFESSERIMKILAKLLHIGIDAPDAKCTAYQPIVFNCTPKTPFLLELFSRSMWLLSRTRREMKVSTITDYPKVIRVLEKQLRMVLERKPKDFKRLTDYMTEITFDTVLSEWEMEKEKQFNELLNNNSCIIELKEILSKRNEQYVVNQRLNVLKEGQAFPKVLEKKTRHLMFVQLSKNEKELLIYDMKNPKFQPHMRLEEKISVSDITHIAAGLNCKHVHLCKSPSLAFSVIINNSEKDVKFIADDEKMACYWTDALYILTKNNRRSSHFQKELDALVEMDVRLKLLDLQNVSIPKEPPPLPPPPNNIPPILPRKSKKSCSRESQD